MAQSSWPITGVNLSDLDWRDSLGPEPGVTGDLDGSAYRVSLPTDSDVAQIGSSTQQSTAQVAGFGHRIPAGETEPIAIPAATGSVRTDIIALRYDPAHTGQPGPVRLVRIAGTAAGLPAYDDDPPGAEELPLWLITRQPGQALSQATVRRLFPRIAMVLGLPPGAPLPTSSPLETIARQGRSYYRRELDASSVPVWVQTSGPRQVLVENGNAGNTGWIALGQTVGVISQTVTSPYEADTGHVHLSVAVLAAAGSSIGNVIVSFAGESYSQIFNVGTTGSPVVIGMPVSVPAGSTVLQVSVQRLSGEACFVSHSAARVTI